VKFPRNAKIFRGQLDAAPFVGVFFLLTIFLLLNTTLVFTPGVRIRLPETSGRPLSGVENPTVVVSIDLSGQLYFENQVIQEKELSRRLREKAAMCNDLVLVIDADKAVELGTFFRLSKLAGDAGLKEVLVAGRPGVRKTPFVP
jgi:biopolymer transport protein ExbD